MEQTAESYLALVAAVQAAAPQPLSALAAGLLAALHLGIAGDSRAFAQQFDIPHALALRAVSELAALDLVETGTRDPRTQRTSYALTRAGRDLLESPPAPAAP
ncbi:hypothetical protein [Dongia sp.]|uniref:hypothetical protein n=1 Tax=Dongia sp. TaxID=1977262 RepID=UPI0035B43E3C